MCPFGVCARDDSCCVLSAAFLKDCSGLFLKFLHLLDGNNDS